MSNEVAKERQREVARKARLKKKQHMHNLEMDVIRLREKNRALLLRTTKGLNQRSSRAEGVRTEHVDRLLGAVKARLSNLLLKKEIEKYKEKYSDYGDERKSKVGFHMSQLEQLLGT